MIPQSTEDRWSWWIEMGYDMTDEYHERNDVEDRIDR